jgi:hypothetical protein
VKPVIAIHGGAGVLRADKPGGATARFLAGSGGRIRDSANSEASLDAVAQQVLLFMLLMIGIGLRFYKRPLDQRKRG